MPSVSERSRWSLAAGLSIGLLWLALSATAQTPDIQSGEIWRYCEEYFVKVEDLKNGKVPVSKDEAHYRVRDLSGDFLRLAKGFRPRSTEEGHVLGECLNLANGNALFSFEQVQNLEAQDDDFVDMATTEAINNSRAKGFDIKKELGQKHDLMRDAEIARATFESELRAINNHILESIAMANMAVAHVTQSQLDRSSQLGLAPGGYNTGYGPSGTIVSFNAFSSVIAKASQSMLQTRSQALVPGLTASAPPGQNAAAPGTFTAAPPTPPSTPGQAGKLSAPAGKPATSTAATPVSVATASGAPASVTPAATPPASATTASATPASTVPAPATAASPAPASAASGSGAPATGTPGPASANATALAAAPALVDTKAPKADARCAAYRLTGDGEKFAEFENKCDIPISWLWCWVPKGAPDCQPDQASEIVPARSRVLLPGPAPNETPQAVSRICDMSDPDKFCTL